MLKWNFQNELEIDNIKFNLEPNKNSAIHIFEENQIVLVRTKEKIKQYLKLSQSGFKPKRILELGYGLGGGLIFFQKLFEPAIIAGIDISSPIDENFKEFLLNKPFNIKIFPNVKQSDTKTLSSITKNAFGDDSINLIVDDASHWYEPTKRSFSYLFPKLSTGGKYIIETWAWSFKKAHQDQSHPWFKKASLVNLIIDLLEEQSINNLIESIEIHSDLLIVTRSHEKKRKNMFHKDSRRGRISHKI